MKYFVLAAVIVLALVALLIGRLPGLWRLNQTALQTAGFMAESDLPSGWWLEPASPDLCEPFWPLHPPISNDRSAEFAGRVSRLQGIIELVCGDREAAATFLRQTEQSGDFDPTLPLLLDLASARPEDTGQEALTGSTNWGVAVEQARQAFEQGDNEAAIKLLDSVQSAITEPAQPDRRSLYLWACFIYRGARQLQSSLIACRQLVEVAPKVKEAWNSLGLTLMAQRQWTEAEQAFAQAVALDSRWATALTNLGRVLIAQERREEAHPYFESVRAIDPDDPWANYYLALDALEAGQCESARIFAQVVVRSENARLARDAQTLLDNDLLTCE